MKFTQNEKKLGLVSGLTLLSGSAFASPVTDMAAAVNLTEVSTAVGTIGVAIIGVVLVIKAIKFIRSAL